ncbi:MAG: hypothetical protein ACJ75H_10095 [Thermoanaerobaculia bacterium]
MKNLQHRVLPILLLLLPAAAHAALAPVGAPLVIADGAPCSFIAEVDVTSTPKGAFEVVWVDDWDEVVKSQRFARNLVPNPIVNLMPLHGGLLAFDIVGTWAGRYESAMNVLDFGEDPDDPFAAYRVQLDTEGHPLAAPVRSEIRDYFRLSPASGGDSLRIRIEPPYFGPPTCQSVGLLARRVDLDGTPLSAESRITRKASAWAGSYLETDRLPNDSFIAAYATCEKFLGVVARRLSPTGVPLGKPINLTFPAGVGFFADGNLVLAARGPADFAVAAMVRSPTGTISGAYTRGVVNGQAFGPTSITAPAPLGVSGVVDLAASSTGRYLLLFQGVTSTRRVLFAQELDAKGVPQGAPLAITGDDEFSATGTVASLPDGRWIVIARTHQSGPDETCTERLVGTILGGS